MKLHLDKIINIKTRADLDNSKFDIDKPIFYDNYLFHYLIILNKLDILKMEKFPVYKMNEDNMDAFMLAAKYDNIVILKYLLKEYPEYCQNHNDENLGFINYLSDSTKIISLMKEFTNIDWYYLFKFKTKKNIDFYSYLISILNFKDLEWILKNFDDPKHFNRYYVLSGILMNDKIKDAQKIKLFSNFSDKDLNVKDSENNGLLVNLINLEDVNMCKYLVDRNLDLEYIIKPITTFITPFLYLYTKLNLMTNKNLIKIIELVWNKIKLDLLFTSKDGIDYLALVLSVRIHSDLPIIKKINEYILINSPDICYNRLNSEKLNNLFLIIKKPFNNYHKYLNNRELNITIKDENKKTVLDYADNKWKEYLLKAKKYKPNLDIKLEENKYQHSTIFTATTIDLIIYFIYLDKKYKNLYIPKIKNDTSNRDNFPWFINYNDYINNLDIHPNINLLINNIRREKSHDFAILFLGLILEKEELQHANILLYDFNNLTVERFEPYGDSGIDDKLDDYLDEELTWNTGFKYLRPKDFLTKPGYQLISNESNENLKAGDFGGFCLGWCIWYIEHRLKNSKINSKILNEKTIEKMLHLDDSFLEYIRNYSNKLFDVKFNILKKICPESECIKEKNISNIYLSRADENKIITFAKDYFYNI
jgi:hypothetical protein